MELCYAREIYLKSLVAKISFLKLLTKENLLKCFISLQLNWERRRIFIHRNFVQKVRANNVDFSTVEITSKKVRGENVAVLISEITSRKVRWNNVDFSTSEITSKKYLKMTYKFVGIYSSTYRRNIDVESTSIWLGVPVGYSFTYSIFIVLWKLKLVKTVLKKYIYWITIKCLYNHLFLNFYTDECFIAKTNLKVIEKFL